ncbi:MAG: hypothetical protein ACOYOJ_09185 [Alsobacter sp.]
MNLQKKASDAISNSRIDNIFEVALKAGAYAGKISGAGEGGFMIFLVAPERRFKLVTALNEAGGGPSFTHATCIKGG